MKKRFDVLIRDQAGEIQPFRLYLTKHAAEKLVEKIAGHPMRLDSGRVVTHYDLVIRDSDLDPAQQVLA